MVRFYLKDSERNQDPQPVAVNAKLAIGVGMLLWTTALLTLLVTTKEFTAEKAGWIATCVCGLVLGLLGYWHVRKR